MKNLTRLLWLLLLSLLIVCPGGAFAQVPVIELAGATSPVQLEQQASWWVDESGTRTVAEVEAQAATLAWQPRNPEAQYRIDGKALWMRFTVEAGDVQPWYLQIRASGLDRAQFFHRDAAGRWIVQEAGDTRPVSAWPLPGRVPTFALSRDLQPVTYWLRIEHSRVDFAAPLALYSHATLLASREREQFLLGAYFGLSALITLVSILNAVAYRDRVFGIYAIYVGLLGAGQLAYLGVGAQHVWERWLGWNAASTFVLPGLSAAAALWFVRAVTEPARFSRLLDRAVWLLIAGLLAAVATDTVMTSRPTFGIVLALTSLALVAVVALILLVWMQGDDPDIKLIALGFVPVVVMAVFPVLRGFNLIPASILTRYGIALGAALEMPILFHALSLRGARRRAAAERAAALPHNDALTGLAHARTLQQRVESALARARSQRHPCALLAVQVANHPLAAAEYGRQVAENVIVVAASQVRRAAGDVDMAARVAEHEFVLLLEGPTTTTAVLSRAQQIVASGLRQSESLPEGLLLRLHVTAAMLPDQDLDAAGSIGWVTSALQAMKPDTRKPIRALNF